jgi:hypothetical protein
LPFALLKSFHGCSFFGLDEMHLWGMNIAKHIWSMMKDDSQRFGYYNPLFLRNAYREEIGRAMVQIQRMLPNGAIDGQFIGIRD